MEPITSQPLIVPPLVPAIPPDVIDTLYVVVEAVIVQPLTVQLVIVPNDFPAIPADVGARPLVVVTLQLIT